MATPRNPADKATTPTHGGAAAPAPAQPLVAFDLDAFAASEAASEAARVAAVAAYNSPAAVAARAAYAVRFEVCMDALMASGGQDGSKLRNEAHRRLAREDRAAAKASAAATRQARKAATATPAKTRGGPPEPVKRPGEGSNGAAAPEVPPEPEQRRLEAARPAAQSPVAKPPLVVSTVEYTRPVGKAFRVVDGKIERVPDWPMRTPTGTGRRHEFDTFDDFMAWRKTLGPTVVLVSGTFEADDQAVVYKYAQTETHIAATKEHLAHRQGPGVMIIDTDVKSAGEVAARFPPEPETWTPQRLLDTLLRIAPELAAVPTMAGWSTSAGITLDGKGRDKPAGVRAYVPVADASQIPALLATLHRRATIAGLGWAFVNAAGYPLYRSIIDTALATVTQPDFAAAHLGEGLVQDRAWITKPGTEYLGALAWSGEDQVLLEAAQAGLREGIGAKVKPVREKFERVLREKHKVSSPAEAVDAMLGGVIMGDMVVQFASATLTVNELLDGRGAEFDGQNCLDPMEPDYRDGNDVGRFYWNEGLAPIIHTFAHGAHSLVLRYAAGAAANKPTPKEAVRALALTHCDSHSERHADKKITARRHKTTIAALDTDITKYIAKARQVAPGFAPRALPEHGDQPDAEADKPTGVLEQLNEEFAFVSNGGSVGVWNPVPVGGVYSVYRVRDWLDKVRPITISSPNGPIPAGPMWMAWPGRRAFDGVGYWPVGQEPPGMLNLYRGLAVLPAAGAWPTLRAFLIDVLCGGNAAYFDYMLRLFAWKLQNPTSPPEVALVLRSDEEGVGKGTAGRLWKRWVGHAFTKAANGKYVFGDFNDCLLGALVMFLDEALFAGDPHQVKVAMAAITEDELVVNPKGRPHVKLGNKVFWIIATNNMHAIAAMVSARRYFVLDIASLAMKDAHYREKVHQAIDGAEAEHLAHELLGMDLTGWHPRDDVPQTEALLEQKRLSLHGPVAWWSDVLEGGGIEARNRNTGKQCLPRDDWIAGSIDCPKSLLFDDYSTSSHATAERGRPMLMSTFNKVMVEITGGQAVRNTDTFRMPPLAECQEHFEKRLAGRLRAQGTISGKFVQAEEA